MYHHPCRLCHVWDQSLYILPRGGFLLYHTEINLVPPPNLCSILMIPLIDSQCLIAPPLCTLSAMTVSPPPLFPWKPCDPPFVLSLPPPPPMINNDRCFGFNFPWAERSNFTSSAQRTCLQHLVSGKLSLFFHFFWLLLFLFLFSVLFLFLCFFYCVVLMPFYPNLCMYL